MKQFVLTILLFVLTLTTVPAQSSDLPSMDELRVPASPAFNLLAVSPATVERPNTPRGFATSILSGLERSNGDFPSDLAIEVAPYWWASHPNLTFEGYYDANVGQTILQTLSVSLATTAIPDATGGGADLGTRAGAGLRFHLLSGDPAPGLAGAVTKLKQAQEDLLAFVPDEGELDESDPEYKRALADVESAGTSVRDFDKQRVGWVLEFASAVAADFPEDDAGSGEISRAGAWLTPAYTSPDDSWLSSLTFVGVARYLFDDLQDESRNMYDVGARVIWKSDEMPIAVSAEHVHRFVEGESDTHRTAGILEYQVNDTYSLIGSFGKNFDTEFEGNADLFVLLGINFGFGKGPVVK